MPTKHYEARKARLVELSNIIASAQVEFMRLKSYAKEQPEMFDDTVTVYTVRRTKVKAHVRRGYTAARVKK